MKLTAQLMGRTSRLKILIVVLTLALAACAPKPANENAPSPVISGVPKTSLPMPPAKGAQLAQLGWVLSDGSHTTVGAYQNKVLLLDFYATWCMPCRDS